MSLRPASLAVERPLLRGWSHLAMFFVAIPAGVVLIVRADHASAITAAAIYTGTLRLSFGTSAIYHRFIRSERALAVWQRLDHAMIYLLITGTYVPACLVALPPAWGIPLLAVVATGAVVGIVIKTAAFHRKIVWLGYALYPALGWAALFVLPVLLDHVGPSTFALIIAGGVLYTIGFPVLMLRRPDPWPRVFGYHEVWHACTVFAAVLHYGAVTAMVG